MQIYLDIDGVLAEFVAGVEKWYNVDLSNHRKFDFDYEEETGMSCEEFWDGLTYDFWFNLEFTPWAQELLEYLMPYDPILLSSPSWQGAGGRQAWIKKHLPGFIERGRYILTPIKWVVAGSGRLLIDDRSRTCKQWREYGGVAIVFPRRWNNEGRLLKDPKQRLQYVFNGVQNAIFLHESRKLTRG